MAVVSESAAPATWPNQDALGETLILAAILARLVGALVVLRNHEVVDFVGFAAGIAAFVLVAVLATLSPARRALRIDPSETLRDE